MSARTILKHLYKEGRMTDYQYERIDRCLKDRPQGEWVVDEFGRKICGKCQFPFAEFQSTCYCSLCGAEMQEVAESCKELQEVAKEDDNGSDQ